MFNLTSP